MIDEKLEVLFVTETLLSVEKQSEMRIIFNEYDVFFRVRKKNQKKQYIQRGGILCIAVKGVVQLEKECKCDDMMWIDWRGVKVACAYFVPPTSPFAKRNEKRMIELQQRALEQNGKVIIMTDSNAWIGQNPSIITESERAGYERQTVTFTRTSEKEDTNQQGEWFLSAMNSIDMIVVNGIRSQAKYTYDHPGREAKSIIDFVVVNDKAYEIVSDLEYTDCRENLQTDHILISVQVQHDNNAVTRTKKKKPKKKTQKPVMERLKTVTRNDDFWKSLKQVCDQTLTDYSTIPGQSLDEDYETFKKKLTEAVELTFTLTKPHKTILSQHIKSNPELAELRKRKSTLFCEAKAERESEKRKTLKREVSRVSTKLKRETRKVVNEFKRRQIREIENLESEDCRRMWKELKTLAGWTRKEEISTTVTNEKKEEVCGEGVYEVWKESFRLLGVEDSKDTRFDVDFGEKIVNQQEEIREESYHPTNFNSRLDSPIT
jgi:hypothetical protein